MFDELFKKLIYSKVQEAIKGLEKYLAVPEIAEPLTLIRQFTIADSTVTKGGIRVVGESWQVEAYDDNSPRLTVNEPLREVILFEIAEPADRECVLACRFQAKALNTEKDIVVKLGLCKQEQIGTTTTGWSTSVSQTKDFRSFEIRAHFKKGTTPTKVQVIIKFESSGILEIRNIELLQAPVKLEP